MLISFSIIACCSLQLFPKCFCVLKWEKMVPTQKHFPFFGLFSTVFIQFPGNKNFWGLKHHYQWHIHRASDAQIPVWAPKLWAQTKEKLIQKYQVFNQIFNAVLPTCSWTFKQNIHKKGELQTLHICVSTWRAFFAYQNVLFA